MNNKSGFVKLKMTLLYVAIAGLFIAGILSSKANAQPGIQSDMVRPDESVCVVSRQHMIKCSVYTNPQEYPEFPGGMGNWGRFISKNLRYPKEANEVSGRVILTFIVNTDGSLSDLKVLRSPHPALSKEAIRLMKASPKWKPGKQNGKWVRVQYTVPIMFEPQRH